MFNIAFAAATGLEEIGEADQGAAGIQIKADQTNASAKDLEADTGAS